MKKIFFGAIFCLPFLFMTVSCDKLTGDDKTEDRISALESEISRIAPVTEQIESVQASIDALTAVDDEVKIKIGALENTSSSLLTTLVALRSEYESHPYTEQGKYLKTLEGMLDKVGPQIKDLENADSKLQAQIDALKTSLSGYASVDWMNATFITFEQQKETANSLTLLKEELKLTTILMNKLQAEFGAVRDAMNQGDAALIQRIDDLVADLGSYKNDFSDLADQKISGSESEIKAWVCDTLTAYYTQGALDALVEKIEKDLTDSLDLAEKTHEENVQSFCETVKGFKADIKNAKAEIKRAYLKAIHEAVDSLGAKVLVNLDSITVANDAINGIMSDLTAVKDTIDALKACVTDIENQIQSVSFVPSDPCGAAVAWYVGPEYKFEDLRLDYIVYPADKKVKAEDITLYYKDVNVMTRANVQNILDIKDCKIDSNRISLTISSDKLLEVLKDQSVAANRNSSIGVRLAIKKGASELGSGFTDVYAKDRIPAGALRGLFEVGDDKYVFFSKGNLQAEVDATGKPTAWKFADRQYNYVGVAVADTTIGKAAGTVDLFGWSSDASKNNWGIHNHTKDSTNTDYVSSTFLDWGLIYSQYNAPGVAWRTMSGGPGSEMGELMSRNRYGFGRVVRESGDTVTGVIVRPKSWTDPNVNSSTKIAEDRKFVERGAASDWDDNIYTCADWNAMEKSGAVFLPAAGKRTGNKVEEVGAWGYYWSGTASTTKAGASYALTFPGLVSWTCLTYYDQDPTVGCAVRLVVDYVK